MNSNSNKKVNSDLPGLQKEKKIAGWSSFDKSGTRVFLLLIFASIIKDFASNETQQCICKHNEIAFINILHHFTSIFILFGWMISDLLAVKIYMLILFIMFIYWRIVGHCQVSIYVNDKCEWHKSKKFNDIAYGIVVNKNILYVLGLTIAICRLKYNF
jgi:hypothetical protein